VDFSFDETQRELRDLARQVLRDKVTHERLVALESAAPSVFDRDLWSALASAGLLGAALPEEHGGGGVGLLGLLPVLEEAGATVAPVPLVPTVVLGGLTLTIHGTDDQRATWLPRIASGDAVLTAALDEPGCVDPTVLRSGAQRIDGGWRLAGEKHPVPYGAEADRVLVPAGTPEGQVVLLLIDPRTEGVRIAPQVTTNRQPVATLEFSAVEVADADVVVGPDDGAAVVTWMIERGAAAWCAVQAGVCRTALKMLAEHTAQRQQFGKPIAEFQAVAQRAADAYIDTEMVRLTAWQAIFRLDVGWPASDEVHVAKFWAGDGAMRVVHAAQHLHGGLGVDLDYPLHRYFLWAKQIEHSLGTPTRELLRLGAALADQPV
jgi:3-oxocholest-4-en-26-oyl-CoA dehydrogenase beta subunit